MTRLLSLLLLLMALPAAAGAQITDCRLPAVLPVPGNYQASEHDPVRDVPIVGYSLAISWAPQYCRSGEGMGGTFDKSFECAGKRSRFGFVLHGLWPDGEGRSWPQYCRPVGRLSPATIRANLCATPSADLLQHEWAKHGSCMARDPDSYFAQARRLYDPLRFPDMNRLSRDRRLTVSDFVRAFVSLNARSQPGLRSSHIRVRTAGGWLLELSICLDERQRSVACPIGKHGAPAGQRLRIWRGD